MGNKVNACSKCEVGGVKKYEDGGPVEKAGGAIKGIGNMASMVPGIGTIAGGALKGIGSIVELFKKPKYESPDVSPSFAQTPYGVFAQGGPVGLNNILAESGEVVVGQEPISGSKSAPMSKLSEGAYLISGDVTHESASKGVPLMAADGSMIISDRLDENMNKVSKGNKNSIAKKYTELSNKMGDAEKKKGYYMFDDEFIQNTIQDLDAQRKEIEQKQFDHYMSKNPQATVRAREGVYISPKEDGAFAKYAASVGMTEEAAYGAVLANKEKYPEKLVQMANFSRNKDTWTKAADGYADMLSQTGFEALEMMDRGVEEPLGINPISTGKVGKNPIKLTEETPEMIAAGDQELMDMTMGAVGPNPSLASSPNYSDVFNTPTSPETPSSNTEEYPLTTGDKLQLAGTAPATLYNLISGLQKPDKETRRPDTAPITKQQISATEGFRRIDDTVRGSMEALTQRGPASRAANLANLTRIASEQKGAHALNVANQNKGLETQFEERLSNRNRFNARYLANIDDMDARNKAAARNMIAAGMTNLGQNMTTSGQAMNARELNREIIPLLMTSDFKYDPYGRQLNFKGS